MCGTYSTGPVQIPGGYTEWRNKYVRSAIDAYYVAYNQDGKADVKNAITCSEAHGYGMLLSVYDDCRTDFDGFLRYFDLFRNPRGLMGWQQVMNHAQQIVPAPEGGEQSATDGDIDIAHALFLAADKWQDPQYHARAVNLCRAIFEHTVNKDFWFLTLGDWVESDDSKFWNVTRTSDYILSAIYKFAHCDVERSAGWKQLLESGLNIILTLVHNPMHCKGLLPDFAVLTPGKRGLFRSKPATWAPVRGKILESEHDGDYHYNACRVTWRLAAYYKASGDSRVVPIHISHWHMYSGGEPQIAGLHFDKDKAFTAPLWASCNAMELYYHHKIFDEMLEDEGGYYGDTIAQLCVAQCQ
ncbi:hypothetical protein HDU86_007449 [Geranomyces michiganensis]|nr:hypothetical protein HDU86_007449 [Geranomyces michiganensis]